MMGDTLTDSASLPALVAQALVHFNLAVSDWYLSFIVSSILCAICRLERGGRKRQQAVRAAHIREAGGAFGCAGAKVVCQ